MEWGFCSSHCLVGKLAKLDNPVVTPVILRELAQSATFRLERLTMSHHGGVLSREDMPAFLRKVTTENTEINLSFTLCDSMDRHFTGISGEFMTVFLLSADVALGLRSTNKVKLRLSSNFDEADAKKLRDFLAQSRSASMTTLELVRKFRGSSLSIISEGLRSYTTTLSPHGHGTIHCSFGLPRAWFNASNVEVSNQSQLCTHRNSLLCSRPPSDHPRLQLARTIFGSQCRASRRLASRSDCFFWQIAVQPPATGDRSWLGHRKIGHLGALRGIAVRAACRFLPQRKSSQPQALQVWGPRRLAWLL